jgi:hypothetical protein
MSTPDVHKGVNSLENSTSNIIFIAVIAGKFLNWAGKAINSLFS